MYVIKADWRSAVSAWCPTVRDRDQCTASHKSLA